MARITRDPPVDLDEAELMAEGPQLTVISSGHRKSYQVGVSHHPGADVYLAWGEWGMIGRRMTVTVMYCGPSAGEAIATAAGKQQEKLQKGYTARRGLRVDTTSLYARFNEARKAADLPTTATGRWLPTWSQRRGDDEVDI